LKDIDSMKLHGNMELADRTACLKRFRSSTTPSSSRRKVLWTTDVAARGLNLSGDASQQSIRIVQYDPPTELSDYLHRAGRTARAGGAGTCLIFTLPTESQPFADLLRETTNNANILLPISLNETLESAAPCFPDLQQNGGRVADAVCLEISRHLEQKVYQSDDLLEMARTAFLAHIRAYAVKEKALKSVFVARGLHLGHVARSFLLKEPPTSFSSGVKRLQKNKGPKHNNNKRSNNKSSQKKQNVVKAPPPGVGQRKKSQLLFSNAAKLEGTMDGL
jgi:ATP-dependent RNA helicase DDX31/DBP7